MTEMGNEIKYIGERVDALTKYGKLFWAMACGVFTLGVLYATTSIRLSNVESTVADIQKDRLESQKEWREWRNGVDVSNARQETLILEVKAQQQRILDRLESR